MEAIEFHRDIIDVTCHGDIWKRHIDVTPAPPFAGPYKRYLTYLPGLSLTSITVKSGLTVNKRAVDLHAPRGRKAYKEYNADRKERLFPDPYDYDDYWY